MKEVNTNKKKNKGIFQTKENSPPRRGWIWTQIGWISFFRIFCFKYLQLVIQTRAAGWVIKKQFGNF